MEFNFAQLQAEIARCNSNVGFPTGHIHS